LLACSNRIPVMLEMLSNEVGCVSIAFNTSYNAFFERKISRSFHLTKTCLPLPLS